MKNECNWRVNLKKWNYAKKRNVEKVYDLLTRGMCNDNCATLIFINKNAREVSLINRSISIIWANSKRYYFIYTFLVAANGQ